MVRIGNKEVIFSSSFVMGKHHDTSVTFNVPNQGLPEFELQVKEKPAEPGVDLPADMWHGVEHIDTRIVVSFDALSEGKTQFYSLGIGQVDQGLDVQIVRQAILNKHSMLVHVIVVREPR